LGVVTSRHAVSISLFVLSIPEHTFQDRARKTESSVFEYAQDLLQQNPYTSTSTIAQAILNASPVLTELIVVREWLQETAPPPMQPEATTGYWKFTKHNIMQTLRTGSNARAGYVKEMDPDAVNRGDGRSLATDDLVRTLFLGVPGDSFSLEL
jgi:nuclear pore complex protein Nup107